MKTILAALLIGTSAFASDDITQGALRVLPKTGVTNTVEMPLKHTDVQAEISGFISRVKVTQTFTNPNPFPIEAVYVFPLPHEAAVSDMQITIGDRVIRGDIKKRDEARRIYEDAKNAGKTAALLDQERPNIFSQSVANIMPGTEIKVEITYDDALNYENGNYSFVFPMVVGPRYNPPGVEDAGKISPPVFKPGERNGHDISLSVRLNGGLPVQELESPTHKIDVKGGDIKLAANDSIPNKDFILRYRLAGDAPEFAALSHHGELGNYFMLMFQPPVAAKPDAVTPKEMVFVMDCSGSMNGEPIALAKKAVRHALQNLNPDDTFQIIRFSESASPLAEKPLPATAENIRRGLSYINGLSGEGGTRMIEGIKAALDYPHEEKRLRIVCFMTDGYIGNESEILSAIGQKLGDDTRLFSFGVGSSVNRYLLDAMAEAGRGEVTYVTLNENPEQHVEKFYERVRNPYVTHIRVDWAGLDVKDLTPARIRDLFIGQPLFLMGRYDRAGAATIKIHAKVNGEAVAYDVPVSLTAMSADNAALASLWARSRIKELSAEQIDEEQPKIVEKITDLALKYRLMSQYTSFVAVEEKVVNENGALKTIQVPVEMPEGVSYEGVFGDADRPFPAAGAPHKMAGLYLSRQMPTFAGRSELRDTQPEAEVAPAPSRYSSLQLELATKDGATLTINESGDVWQGTTFITRLTQAQMEKLIALLETAIKGPAADIAHAAKGSLKLKLIGDHPFEITVTLDPKGVADPGWKAALDYVAALTGN